ncbi:MAG: cytochrome c family protein [Fuscovulum sp.]|jgi:cytochrome c|nr:cytochrome c family protein [Paracoccaceae bacterium]MCZ8082145.1 cytochrome c family protein [Paracoccaceae bacterium]WRH63408.1 MAG: cytochrome c family protein [Fuscovulum sp.]
MFDTMTITKATGAVCGSLLVYLLAAWAGDSLYHVGHDSHGGEEIAQAYSIDTGSDEASSEVAADAPDFATLYAAADVAAGEKVFAKCKSCHKLDGSDGVGPHLNGIVDKQKGTSAGYAYSDALAALTAEVWSPENLNGFLENPKGYMPGTKMSFAGLPKVDERANLIAYLATVQ